MTPNPYWRDEALCREVDLELFFPGQGTSSKEAKAICHRCPVAAACLAYAWDRPELYGIWGGKTAYERLRMRTRGLVPPVEGRAA